MLISTSNNSEIINTARPLTPIKSPTISNHTEDTNTDNECPICLDDKEQFHFLICGHKICLDCKNEMYRHNCLHRCPICRCELNWLAYIQFNGEEFVLREDTPQTVIDTIGTLAPEELEDSVQNIVMHHGIYNFRTGENIIQVNVREIVNDVDGGQREINISQEHRRTIRRHRRETRIVIRRNDYSQECIGNVFCAFIVICFLIAFTFSQM